MDLILGKINTKYLRNITLNAVSGTEEVLAAVAYASDSSLLFDWCLKHKICLRYYGRLDETVPVSIPILKDFLKIKSPNYVCKLVSYHHAKVIWWRGFGLYIGSANLSDSAWNKNIEAGCFFSEHEITDEMATEVQLMFDTLEENSTPLTDELLEVMEKRYKKLSNQDLDSRDFWNSTCFKKWSGLNVASNIGSDNNKRRFLNEWHSTLQDLRNIADRLNLDENRPNWVHKDAPAGAHVDQFLHAFYQTTLDGRRAQYNEFYDRNKHRREEALTDAIYWWRNLSEAPGEEDKILNSVAPFLRKNLSKESIENLDKNKFIEICNNINAFKEYSRRVPNIAVGLPDVGTHYNIAQKVEALSKRIWGTSSPNGKKIKEILLEILYGGTDDALPERLFRSTQDSNWKIEGLGVSILGEIIGWALPDKFPPRNGRTSKALKALGYDVKIHVG